MSENGRKSMIKVRGGFSDKTGINPCNTQIQLDEFDDRTRTTISNQLFRMLEITFSNPLTFAKSPYDQKRQLLSNEFCRAISSDILSLPSRFDNSKVYNWHFFFEKFSNIIDDAPYNEVLDVVWYCCHWLSTCTILDPKDIYDIFNETFGQEYVGYRFISGEIVPITDENEVNEIEQACKTPFDGARTQLQKALCFLSDRENPDYKNCIKESISAVESVCKVISGNEKAALKDALNGLISNGMNIHGSLKTAILALYGYASDEGGIRHAERETESTVTFEEAKFMMVTCSAIVNYLVAEYGKHGAGNA